MTEKDFQDIVKELMKSVEINMHKHPYPVSFDNCLYDTKKNAMFIIKSTYVDNGISKETGIILRISLKMGDINCIYIVAPFYSYDNMNERDEINIVRKVGSLLNDIIERKSKHNSAIRGFVICEIGDVKIKLKNKPNLPKNPSIIVTIS